MNSRPLILFTHFYPFGDRELFLETEIRYLKEQFAEIIIVPNQITGPLREVPEGVIVETSFAETFCGKEPMSLVKKLGRALLYPPLYSALCHTRKKLPYLRKLLGYSSEACRCSRWVNSFLQKQPHLQRAIFYTYWFYDHTTGILRQKKSFPEIKVISRAHGFDLYESDYNPPFIPFREASIHAVDQVFLISEHGRSYLKTHFSNQSEKMCLSRLGIEDPGFIVQKKTPGKFIIVSCSHLVPLKRLDLQIEALSAWAKKNPTVEAAWFHIGDGPLKSSLIDLAHEMMPQNMKWSFLGHLPNQEVFAFYKNRCPDVFLLLSETEGLPVCLMEAYACGIAAIATNVGGVSEIVNEENGILLPSNLLAKNIEEALNQAFLHPEEWRAKGAAARKQWKENFQASTNYRLFAESVHSVN